MKSVSIPGGGSVELMNYTPNGDLLVVNAARASFDKEHGEFKDKKDTKLINYLAEHKHVLPFRHPSATLRITAPIFVLRQLGKSQVGYSWSEVSRRYISSDPEFFAPESWRLKADDVKQGSSALSLEGIEEAKVSSSYEEFCNIALELYNSYLERGVAPELARIVLPQSMHTTTVTTGTMLAWHHMVMQRTDSHTQKESRDYAQAIDGIMEELFPVSWEALRFHIG